MPQLAVTELIAVTVRGIPIPSVVIVSIFEFAFPPRGSALRLLLCDVVSPCGFVPRCARGLRWTGD